MSLPSLAADAALVSYGLVTGLLAVVGTYYGIIAVERVARGTRPNTTTDPEPPVDHPVVTVQVPVYNERHVVDRVLRAVGNLRWPKDDLEIQIIDDSTDATTEVIETAVARLRADGHTVKYLYRADRVGTKPGRPRPASSTPPANSSRCLTPTSYRHRTSSNEPSQRSTTTTLAASRPGGPISTRSTCGSPGRKRWRLMPTLRSNNGSEPAWGA